MENKEVIANLIEVIESSNSALNSELEKLDLPEFEQEATADSDNSAADIAARYWLMQFLEPLSRKELKSIIDGFMVQLLNESQAKKLVRFLMQRFPQYYKRSPEDDTKFEAKRPV